ncbi:hypothetical protein HW537_10815 [Asaia siamensis]
MDKFTGGWPLIGLGLMIAFDIWIWFFPVPGTWQRRTFMSGCLTSAGYSDAAQQRCYADFVRYREIKAREYLPPTSIIKGKERADG